MPVSSTSMTRAGSAPGRSSQVTGQTDSAPIGELDRIVDEIDEDLLEPQPIGGDELGRFPSKHRFKLQLLGSSAPARSDSTTSVKICGSEQGSRSTRSFPASIRATSSKSSISARSS